MGGMHAARMEQLPTSANPPTCLFQCSFARWDLLPCKPYIRDTLAGGSCCIKHTTAPNYAASQTLASPNPIPPSTRHLAQPSTPPIHTTPSQTVASHACTPAHPTPQRPWFNLEARAVNNATFRSPDEDGWQPDCCPIASIPGMPLDCSVSSDLDLARLHRHLRARGHDVKLSSDAGRFVCNWTYYNSLALCKEAMAVAAAAAAAAAEAFGGRSSSPSSNSSSGSGGGGGNCSRSASGCDSVGEAWCSGGCSPRTSLPASPLGRTGSGFGEAPRAPGANPFSSGPGGSSRASGKGCSGAGGGLIVHSLFVHVPSFDSIGQARQQRFAVDLLELLCDQLHERYFGRGGGSGASGGSSECGVLSGDRYRHRHHHHAHGSHGHVYGHGHNFSGGLQLYAAVGSDCGSSCSSTSSGGGGNGSYFSHQLTRQGFGHQRSPATGMSNSATLQQQQHQQQLLLLSQQLFLMHQQAAAAPQLQYPQQQMHHHHYHQHQHHQQPQLLELHLQQERQWLAGALLPQLQTMASDYEQPLASGRQQVLLA